MPRIIPAIDRLAWLQYLPMPTVYAHQVDIDVRCTSSIRNEEPTVGSRPKLDIVWMLVVDVPRHLHNVANGASQGHRLSNALLWARC